jgi:hypothetical protein
MDTCGNVWRRMPERATVFRDLRAGLRQAVVSGFSWGVRAAMVEGLTSHFIGVLSNDDPEVNHTQARFLANVGAGLSVAVLNLAGDKFTRVLLNYGGYTEDTPEADAKNVQLNTNIRDVVYVGSFTASSLAVAARGHGMTILVSGGTGAAAACLTLWVGRAYDVHFKQGVVNLSKPDWTDVKRKLIAGAGMGGIAYGFEILVAGEIDSNTVAIWLQRALGPITRLGGWFGCQRLATPAPDGAVTALSNKDAQGRKTPAKQTLPITALSGQVGASSGLASTSERLNPATPMPPLVKLNSLEKNKPSQRRSLSSLDSSVPASRRTSLSVQSQGSNSPEYQASENGDRSDEDGISDDRKISIPAQSSPMSGSNNRTPSVSGCSGVLTPSPRRPERRVPISTVQQIRLVRPLEQADISPLPVQSRPETVVRIHIGERDLIQNEHKSFGLRYRSPPLAVRAGSPSSDSLRFTVQPLSPGDNEPGGLGRSPSSEFNPHSEKNVTIRDKRSKNGPTGQARSSPDYAKPSQPVQGQRFSRL